MVFQLQQNVLQKDRKIYFISKCLNIFFFNGIETRNPYELISRFRKAKLKMIPNPSPHCPAIFCVDLVLARILPFYPEKNGLCHKHLYKL